MNGTTFDATTFAASLTPDDAYRLLVQIERKFGWCVALLTDEDIRETWRDRWDEQPTEEQVQAVVESRDWRKYIPDYAATVMMEGLRDAVSEVGGDNEAA